MEKSCSWQLQSTGVSISAAPTKLTAICTPYGVPLLGIVSSRSLISTEVQVTCSSACFKMLLIGIFGVTWEEVG